MADCINNHIDKPEFFMFAGQTSRPTIQTRQMTTGTSRNKKKKQISSFHSDASFACRSGNNSLASYLFAMCHEDVAAGPSPRSLRNEREKSQKPERKHKKTTKSARKKKGQEGLGTSGSLFVSSIHFALTLQRLRIKHSSADVVLRRTLRGSWGYIKNKYF